VRRLQSGANDQRRLVASSYAPLQISVLTRVLGTSARYSVNGISALELIQKRARVVEEVGAIKREGHLAVNFEKSVGDTETPYVGEDL
jgi:chorismate mutase